MASSRSTAKPWSVDLTLREQDVGYSVLQQKPSPLGMRKLHASERQIQSGSGDAVGDKASSSQSAQLVAKKKAKAMSIATSPGKQILMNGFMMWMSGKTLNIFSISITSMALMNPVKSILGLGAMFRPYEDPDGKVDLQTAKLVFVALNLVWFGVGLWKMGTMRLLPTTSADWSSYVVWKEMLESSSAPP